MKMAFLNKSIEDSLKLIGGNSDEATATVEKPKRKRGRPRKKPIQVPAPSPVRQQSPAARFSPFRTTSRPSSPISLQRTPEAEERIVPPVTPTEINTQKEEEEVDIQQNETKNITEELKTKHFNVIRYLQNENNFIYAIAYDPNGQVVYIELNSDDFSSSGGNQITRVNRQDFIEYPFAIKDYYKNKINGLIYGVVLTRGENMCFLTKTDNGDIIENYYGSVESLNDRINCYCVFKYTDIIEDLETSLQSIMYTYEMIQQHQLVTNKTIYRNTMEEISKLYLYSQEFDKIYKKYTETILDDWQKFSNVSVDYIDKFLEEGLTNEESEKFEHISANLFARFQAFNNISNSIEELKIVNANTLPIKNILKDSIEQFSRDTTRMSGKILDPSEVDVLL